MIQEVTLSELVGEDGVFVDGDWVESKDQDINGDVRLIQLADIGDGNFINKSNRFLTSKRARELNCTFLEPGDLLIARMPDPIGRACVFPGLKTPCVTVVDVCIVRPNKTIVSNEWLKFMINSFEFRNGINRFITGTTRQRISRGNLSKLKFKLPPLEDQIRIATILSKAEALINQRKESLRLLDEILKSAFLEMFGDPVRNNRKLPQISLGELGTWKSGGTPSRTNSSYFKGTIPWVTSGELNEMYIEDAKEKITLQAIDNSNASKVEPGSLLLGMYDTAALKSSINKKVVTCNQAIAFSKLNSELCDTIFVYYTIQIGKEHFRSQQRGVRQKNLNLAMIKGIKLLNPPLEQQKRFATTVERINGLKAQYHASLQELENLYASLSRKSFKGELQFKPETKVVPLPTNEKEQDYFKKRKALACYIINQSLDDDKFGDTKFEKLLNLADQYAIQRNLGQSYYQKVAGPYDNEFTKLFYIQIAAEKLYKRKRIGKQSVFIPGINHKKTFTAEIYFSSDELARVDKLITYFQKYTYEQPEIISTLYAVWNNRIIRQQQITDEVLKQDFLDWDEKKKKYKDRLDAALAWMRNENIIPNGWGKLIEKPKGKQRKLVVVKKRSSSKRAS